MELGWTCGPNRLNWLFTPRERLFPLDTLFSELAPMCLRIPAGKAGVDAIRFFLILVIPVLAGPARRAGGAVKSPPSPSSKKPETYGSQRADGPSSIPRARLSGRRRIDRFWFIVPDPGGWPDDSLAFGQLPGWVPAQYVRTDRPDRGDSSKKCNPRASPRQRG